MSNSFRKLFALLNGAEKRSFVILVVIMLAEATLEMLGVAIVPLYITALAYPESIITHPWLRAGLTPAWQAWLSGERLLVWGGLGMLAFYACKTVYAFVAGYWKARFAQNRALKLSLRLFRAYLEAPYVFHLRNNASDLLRNVNQECTQLATRVLLPMVESISNALILCGISAVLVVTMPLPVLAWMLCFLLLGIGSATALQQRVKHLGNVAIEQRARTIQTVTEGLGGVKEIQLLQRTGHFVERLGRTLGTSFTVQRNVQLVQRGIPQFIELAGIGGLIGVTLMLHGRGSPNEDIVATLSIFAVALARMKGAVRGVMDNITEVRHYGASLDVVHANLLALEHTQVPAADDAPLTFTQTIELRGLCYRYPGAAEDSLRGISLSIARGEAIGFVGSTGAGKSTLLDLILGVLAPTAGSIHVDGVDIRQAPRRWQRNLGYVPQAFFLIDASVAENIALGLDAPAIDRDRVERAAAAAALLPLIEHLPRGLDTLVGERGIRLSGGERQRIAIARALYHNPDILVMDEATSALDNTTEAAVIEAVGALKGDRTVLMVAHRLSTVRRCDRIVFLKHGRIDAIGTYEELEARHGEFRRMTQA